MLRLRGTEDRRPHSLWRLRRERDSRDDGGSRHRKRENTDPTHVPSVVVNRLADYACA
jgi:hypothetical protein